MSSDDYIRIQDDSNRRERDRIDSERIQRELQPAPYVPAPFRSSDYSPWIDEQRERAALDARLDLMRDEELRELQARVRENDWSIRRINDEAMRIETTRAIESSQSPYDAGAISREYELQLQQIREVDNQYAYRQQLDASERVQRESMEAIDRAESVSREYMDRYNRDQILGIDPGTQQARAWEEDRLRIDAEMRSLETREIERRQELDNVYRPRLENDEFQVRALDDDRRRIDELDRARMVEQFRVDRETVQLQDLGREQIEQVRRAEDLQREDAERIRSIEEQRRIYDEQMRRVDDVRRLDDESIHREQEIRRESLEIERNEQLRSIEHLQREDSERIRSVDEQRRIYDEELRRVEDVRRQEDERIHREQEIQRQEVERERAEQLHRTQAIQREEAERIRGLEEQRRIYDEDLRRVEDIRRQDDERIYREQEVRRLDDERIRREEEIRREEIERFRIEELRRVEDIRRQDDERERMEAQRRIEQVEREETARIREIEEQRRVYEEQWRRAESIRRENEEREYREQETRRLENERQQGAERLRIEQVQREQLERPRAEQLHTRQGPWPTPPDDGGNVPPGPPPRRHRLRLEELVAGLPENSKEVKAIVRDYAHERAQEFIDGLPPEGRQKFSSRSVSKLASVFANTLNLNSRRPSRRANFNLSRSHVAELREAYHLARDADVIAIDVVPSGNQPGDRRTDFVVLRRTDSGMVLERLEVTAATESTGGAPIGRAGGGHRNRSGGGLSRTRLIDALAGGVVRKLSGRKATQFQTGFAHDLSLPPGPITEQGTLVVYGIFASIDPQEAKSQFDEVLRKTAKSFDSPGARSVTRVEFAFKEQGRSRRLIYQIGRDATGAFTGASVLRLDNS